MRNCYAMQLSAGPVALMFEAAGYNGGRLVCAHQGLVVSMNPSWLAFALRVLCRLAKSKTAPAADLWCASLGIR